MSRRVLYVYVGLSLTYALLTFLIPSDPATLKQYEITEFQADLLNLSIVVPLVAIWFAAFYGFDKFNHYAETIRNSKDGKAFALIAIGLGVLAVSMPITSILSSIARGLAIDSPDMIPAATIFRNYVSIVIPLAAFWFIYRGSQELKGVISRKKERPNEFSATVTMLTAILAVLYTFLIFQNQERQIPAGEAWRATYYLPDWLILFTVILPYLFIWLIGFQAVANIGNYTYSVKGVLYKQMLGLLAKGLAAIVLISIILQLLVNFASLFRSMSLGPLLAIVYLLVAAIAVGYLYVAAGAKRLQKIEDV